MQHSIESQTTLSDIAHVKAPIDVIMGNLEEFLYEAVVRIVERVRGSPSSVCGQRTTSSASASRESSPRR